ncbi:acetoacetate decarboxylase family protein [Cryptosporangium arvum]|uniref:Acetoacetate decarboxylase (ADC) n=1 Tax=Cryptosporangium arvum DSM 44712 TaxID=927661 RepID=A0A010ZR20_9ACTN|nr:acetoacetate decarboxylase family protein [Cryptosporangium arvum]EXG79657.1 Acetoacetate decarboxylase (ADC) [Cryptosporangium arvum DSM 44712]
MIPSVPESLLATDVVLPESSAPAPWRTKIDAAFWWHRASPDAAAQLPVELRALGTIPVTLVAFVRYRESPVGPYSEVFASPVLLRQWPVPPLHVPFIAVDSLASVHGGRVNWALPKAVASFTWGSSSIAASGDGWDVAATAQASTPKFPVAGGLKMTQLFDEGPRSAWVGLYGRARLGRVTVAASGPTLSSWLLPGRHPALIISDSTMNISAPR